AAAATRRAGSTSTGSPRGSPGTLTTSPRPPRRSEPMSHATHFLSRLERIEPAEVELAMSLYRDTPLVKELLARAKLPDGASRVALSLDDPGEGPFVLLERDGGFVTCLARGMRPGDLPII